MVKCSSPSIIFEDKKKVAVIPNSAVLDTNVKGFISHK